MTITLYPGTAYLVDENLCSRLIASVGGPVGSSFVQLPTAQPLHTELPRRGPVHRPSSPPQPAHVPSRDRVPVAHIRHIRVVSHARFYCSWSEHSQPVQGALIMSASYKIEVIQLDAPNSLQLFLRPVALSWVMGSSAEQLQYSSPSRQCQESKEGQQLNYVPNCPPMTDSLRRTKIITGYDIQFASVRLGMMPSASRP